jgi:hypothetical protein
MRLAGVAAVVGVALVVVGCGLGLGGLEDVPPGTDGGAADDVATTHDVTVGDDGGSAEGAEDASSADTATTADSGIDSPSEEDSPAPPPPIDAGCTGVVCNGFCTSAPNCRGCGGANLLCPGTNTCTSDCTACPGSPIQCFACDATRLNPIGTCQPDNPAAYCLDTNYAGAYLGGPGTHCACTLSSTCYGDTQVCTNVGAGGPLGCFTCGETDTDGIVCKSGNGSAKCDQKMATCH